MSCRERVQLKGRIEAKTVETFKELVIAKHGKLDGFLSYELETAIKQYIASYKVANAHTQMQQIERANPTPKVYRLYHEIREYISSADIYGGRLPQFVPENYLMEAIHALRGDDDRTYKKWMDRLVRYGCIKRSGGMQIELV